MEFQSNRATIPHPVFPSKKLAKIKILQKHYFTHTSSTNSHDWSPALMCHSGSNP